ncbi:MAG: dipeptide epimerase, partial [Planctomycetes bacterium]|nr:dipeptide epimerase [Planctomycetota bacterium]
MSTAPVKRLTIHTLAIPLRSTVSHAAATRRIADPVVVAIELRGGVVGYGETLPRSYVTGETVGSVEGDIREQLVPRLLEMRPASFPEALELIDALPMVNDRGIIMTAARAAVELALLDAYARHFDRSISELAGWLGAAGLG